MLCNERWLTVSSIFVGAQFGTGETQGLLSI